MKHLFCWAISLLFLGSTWAKDVYTINADSTKLTGCDSNELIIENHTQNIPGFLFNTGRGRTAFKRALTKLNDTLYTVGPDTLRVGSPWPGCRAETHGAKPEYLEQRINTMWTYIPTAPTLADLTPWEASC